MSKQEGFISEHTRGLILEHQEAVIRAQKVEAAALRLRTLQAEKERERQKKMELAKQALRKLQRSENPKHRPLERLMEGITQDLQQGKGTTSAQLTKLRALMQSTR